MKVKKLRTVVGEDKFLPLSTLRHPAGASPDIIKTFLMRVLEAGDFFEERIENLSIPSALSYDELFYQIHRNFPTNNCIGLYLKVLDSFRDIPTEDGFEDKGVSFSRPQKAVIFYGPAGNGKTSTLIAACYLVFGEEPIVFHAAGKNLERLLVEPKLTHGSESAIKILADRYNGVSGGFLSKEAKRKLEEHFPEAFTHQEPKKFEPYKISFSEESIRILETLCKWEGIIVPSEGLGIEFEYGDLVRAFEEGRPLIIDEFDKSIGGSQLNLILQVLSGDLDMEAKFHEKGLSFHFDPKKIKPGFRIFCTANNALDNAVQQELAESFSQRFEKFEVKDVDTLDIAIRIFQRLTRVNPNTITSVSSAHLAEDINFLYEQVGKPLDEEEYFFLSRPKETLQACYQLAGWASCCNFWTQQYMEKFGFEDPNSKIDKKVIGVRFMVDLVSEAKYSKFLKKSDPQKFSQTPKRLRTIHENIKNNPPAETLYEDLSLGEKIERVVQARIERLAPEQPFGGSAEQINALKTLRNQLLSEAYFFGLRSEPPEENIHGDQTHSPFLPITKLLPNPNNLEKVIIDEETFKIHEYLGERIKEVYINSINSSSLPAKKKSEQIKLIRDKPISSFLSIELLQKEIDDIKKELTQEALSRAIYVFNEGFGDQNQLCFKKIDILSTSSQEDLKIIAANKHRLMSIQDFVEALGNMVLRHSVLRDRLLSSLESSSGKTLRYGVAYFKDAVSGESVKVFLLYTVKSQKVRIFHDSSVCLQLPSCGDRVIVTTDADEIFHAALNECEEHLAYSTLRLALINKIYPSEEELKDVLLSMPQFSQSLRKEEQEEVFREAVAIFKSNLHRKTNSLAEILGEVVNKKRKPTGCLVVPDSPKDLLLIE